MDSQFTVSDYLLQRLQEIGIKHLFGVPGDYNLDFLDDVMESPIKWVGNCNELNAGYAADGYARLNGIGAAVVTYGVGGFSIINAVAGAYAEHVPMIIINGAPPARRREAGAMVHHLVSNYYLQFDIFKKITIDAILLVDPVTAPDEIDRVISNCMAHKLPAYIELPADITHAPCHAPEGPLIVRPLISNTDSLAECTMEAAGLLNKSANPMILAGVELLRFGLGDQTLQLIETSEVPFATMLSSKSVVPELHPQFTGIYQGGWSKNAVRQQVENSDCLLSLGALMTDTDTGLFSINLDTRRMITVGGGKARIGNHIYDQVQLGDFIRELTLLAEPRSYLASHPAVSYRPRHPFIAMPSCELTAPRLYECINSYLDDQMVLLSEPGDSFCATPEFNIEEAENFIVQAYYCSIGFCTPAALGVALARPSKRPVVLTGDGAFQMTAQEVSTLIRERCPAIIIIINNDGYLIERCLHKDGMYNDIQKWQYSRLPEVFDDGSLVTGTKFVISIKATTEEELELAMKVAISERDKLIFIEAYLPNRTCSEGLERLGNSYKMSQQKQ
ncbi:MAG: thiamine pyrophosphate-binding protein [Bacteroidales bacterium]|jgi:indolepyruvate decarboxylase